MNSAITGTRYTNAGITCIASSNGRIAAKNRSLRPAMMPTGSAIAIEITTATSTWLSVSIVSTQMLPLAEPSACKPGDDQQRDRAHHRDPPARGGPRERGDAARRPPTTAGSTRKSRIGSSTWMTMKSLIEPVPPMIGTPLRKLSRHHSTTWLTGIVQREVDRRRERARRPELADDDRDDHRREPASSSTRARSGVRSRRNARAARTGRPAVSRSSTIATATIASPASNAWPTSSVLQAGEHLLAESLGADERGDHDDAEREVDRLVHAEQQRGPRDRELDLPQRLARRRAVRGADLDQLAREPRAARAA